MSVNIKVTGGLNIEWGQIDPKATGGLSERRARKPLCSCATRSFSVAVSMTTTFDLELAQQTTFP